MISISRYSYVNAKIRTMLSFLLDTEMLSNLVNAGDLASVFQILKGTAYKNIVDKFEREGLSIVSVEKECLRQEISLIKKIYSSISSANEKNIVALLLQKYEIEEIKTALRLWNRKSGFDASYFLGEKICFDIDYSKIVSSKDLNGIRELLINMPYRKDIDAAKKTFEETKALFVVESYLDRGYFARIVSAMKKLSFADRDIAKKIIGVEIDIENLNWLIRAKKYYSLKTEEIAGWVIEGGKLTKKDFVNVFLSGEVKSVYNIELKDIVDSSAYMLEISLYQILAREARKTLSGFPFTIGTVLAYIILKRRETKSVISIINAKNYNIVKEDILTLAGI